MKRLREKMRRVEPILRLRQADLDRVSAELVALKQKKAERQKDLLRSQREYLDGINTANTKRESERRDALSVVESGIELLKKRWHDLFFEVTRLNEKEKELVHEVEIAHRNVKQLTLLTDKYKAELRRELSKMDQKATDEAAIRMHIQQQRQVGSNND